METRKTDHFALAKTLISGWWSPVEETDGYSTAELVGVEDRLGIRLPESMREWYQYAGRRVDFIGNVDHLLPIHELTIADSILLFCVENQAVVRWGISTEDLDSEDPRVLVELVDYPDEVDRDLVVNERIEGLLKIQWIEAAPSFSRFMTGMIVLATLLQAQYSDRGMRPLAWVDAVTDHYRQLPLPTPLTSAQARLFGDSDTLIEVSSTDKDDKVFVMVAVRSREAVERFLDVTGRGNNGYVTLDHRGEWWGHRYSKNCCDVDPMLITNRRSKYWSEEPYYPPCHSKGNGMTAFSRTSFDESHGEM